VTEEKADENKFFKHVDLKNRNVHRASATSIWWRGTTEFHSPGSMSSQIRSARFDNALSRAPTRTSGLLICSFQAVEGVRWSTVGSPTADSISPEKRWAS